jgi:uncharacterized protein YyaL (SSP411 family)
MLNTVYPFYEVAVVGNNAGPLVKSMNSVHLPNTLVVGSREVSDAPLFEDRFVVDGTYIYVCQNTTCKLPVTTVEEALVQLNSFK